MENLEKIKLNEVEYVRADQIHEKAEILDGMEYCIVRTYSAGVFAGYIKSRENDECTIIKSRRIWYWSGAASLSQLAVDGTSDPKNCKFPCEVEESILLGVIEIILCTETARKSIRGVKTWKK